MQNYKQYQSPIHLTNHFNDSTTSLTKENIALLKKEALLELQFNNNQIIETKHYKYTKQDVLNSFDSLSEDLEFHLYIWNQPELLDLLEAFEFEGHISTIRIAFEKSPYRAKMEPYLVHAVKGIVKDCVQRNVYRDTLTLSTNIIFYDNDSFKNAYKPLLITVSEFINEFSTRDVPPFNEEKYDFLTSSLFIRTLNEFPKEYIELRDDFANATINFIFHYNKQHLDFCKRVNSTTLLLKCDIKIQRQISSNYNYVDEKSKPLWMKNIMPILLVISVLVRLLVAFFR